MKNLRKQGVEVGLGRGMGGGGGNWRTERNWRTICEGRGKDEWSTRGRGRGTHEEEEKENRKEKLERGKIGERTLGKTGGAKEEENAMREGRSARGWYSRWSGKENVGSEARGREDDQQHCIESGR